MMNKTKLTDLLGETLEAAQPELHEQSSEYREGFEDGAYVFFTALLGEVPK